MEMKSFSAFVPGPWRWEETGAERGQLGGLVSWLFLPFPVLMS